MAIRRWNGYKALCELRERFYAIIHRAPLVVSQLDFLLHTMEVELSLLDQRRRRFFGQIETALRTGHAMGTLLKEVISAESVPQIIALPWFSLRGGAT